MVGELDLILVFIALLSILIVYFLLFCTFLLNSSSEKATELIRTYQRLCLVAWESHKRVDLWRKEPKGVLRSIYALGHLARSLLLPLSRQTRHNTVSMTNGQVLF